MGGTVPVVRAMTHDDIRAAQLVTVRALDDLMVRTQDPAWAGMPAPTEESLEGGAIRYRCFVDHDPRGALVAEADGVVVGAALALRRGNLWGLSLLMVDPQWQSAGVGKTLLGHALDYGRDAKNAVIMSSPDSRALRAYTRSGFDLMPEMTAYGPVARERIPAITGIRSGDLSDLEICDRADEFTRGAAHGANDIGVLMMRGNQLIIADDVRGTGYVCVKDGEVALLAATTEDAAMRLLWAALATTPDSGSARVTSLTAQQGWAIRTVLECGMQLSHVVGGILVRGAPGPLTPYLMSGAFL